MRFEKFVQNYKKQILASCLYLNHKMASTRKLRKIVSNL